MWRRAPTMRANGHDCAEDDHPEHEHPDRAGGSTPDSRAARRGRRRVPRKVPPRCAAATRRSSRRRSPTPTARSGRGAERRARRSGRTPRNVTAATRQRRDAGTAEAAAVPDLDDERQARERRARARPRCVGARARGRRSAPRTRRVAGAMYWISSAIPMSSRWIAKKYDHCTSASADAERDRARAARRSESGAIAAGSRAAIERKADQRAGAAHLGQLRRSRSPSRGSPSRRCR